MSKILGDRESDLRYYLNDVAMTRFEPLSREREVALASRIKKGDLQARNELVQANLRFVISVAKNYQHRGLPFSDLISAGNLGLITAAERFDGAKGHKFISYAVWWIRQSILTTLADHSRTVRLPLNKVGLLRDISKAARHLGQELEEEPDAEAIAAELGLPTQEVQEALLNARTVFSLDQAFHEDDEPNNRLKVLTDGHQEAPDALALRASAREHLERVLSNLDEREQRILCLYLGLDGEEGLTLEAIGKQMGVTRERIRQIKDQALSKLRHPSRRQDLESLITED